MIGDNLKKLRRDNNMTQKDLADKLYVTAQAVSRWENEEVEPSVSTIAEMAKIFNVSVDYILGLNTLQESSNSAQDNDKEIKQVLTICEKCNSPIYNKEDINRYSDFSGNHVVCPNCMDQYNKEQQDIEIDNHNKDIRMGKRRRLNAYIFGGIIGLIALIFSIYLIITEHANALDSFLYILVAIMVFTFTACICFQNNFIFRMVVGSFTRGLMQTPGLIFDLSLDGFLWFITVKLGLLLLNFLIAILVIILAVITGLILSIFVFPFAVIRNIRKPEFDYDVI